MIRIRYISRQFLTGIGTSGWMNRNYTTLGITQHTSGRIRIQHGCSELFGLIGSGLRVPALFLCRVFRSGSGPGFNPYNCSCLYLYHLILFGGLMKGKQCLPNVSQRNFYFFRLNISSLWNVYIVRWKKTVQLCFIWLAICNDCVLVLGTGAMVRLSNWKKGSKNNDLLNKHKLLYWRYWDWGT